MGCSPWGRKESDTTGRLHFYFSLSCIGEGNGNPLQSSCLENPRDGGAWWAAIYGVTQSWTRLKRLSSSSSNKVLQTGWFKTTEMCCLRVLGATSLKAWCSWGHGPTVQFGSVAQSCPTLCDPMNGSTPGLPVHHQLPALQSKGFSRVFSSTTVQKHQFFGARLSSQSNSHIHMWPLDLCWQSNISAFEYAI